MGIDQEKQCCLQTTAMQGIQANLAQEVQLPGELHMKSQKMKLLTVIVALHLALVFSSQRKQCCLQMSITQKIKVSLVHEVPLPGALRGKALTWVVESYFK